MGKETKSSKELIMTKGNKSHELQNKERETFSGQAFKEKETGQITCKPMTKSSDGAKI